MRFFSFGKTARKDHKERAAHGASPQAPAPAGLHALPRRVALAGVTAGLYAGLTLLFGQLSFMPQQIRFAESLTVLPFLFPEAVPGLTLGCLLANLIGGYGPLDVIFGTLATFLAGVLTLKTKNIFWAPLWPVLLNALLVGAVLTFTVGPQTYATFALFAAEVGFGQAVACYALGLPLLLAFRRLLFTVKTKNK